MRKYSQRELLEEGFWSGFGRAINGAARAVVKGGANLVSAGLPELTNTLNRTEEGIRSFGRDVKSGWEKGFISKEERVKKELEKYGYVYDKSGGIKKVDDGLWMIFGKKIKGRNVDTGELEVSDNRYSFTLDKEFNINHATAPRKQTNGGGSGNKSKP